MTRRVKELRRFVRQKIGGVVGDVSLTYHLCLRQFCSPPFVSFRLVVSAAFPLETNANKEMLPIGSVQINITRGELSLAEGIKHGNVLGRNLYLALFVIKYEYVRV